MIKIFLTILTGLFGLSAVAQTTATNFNLNDCKGTNHNLFAELNAGKVIVVVWVMPCGACVGPAVAAYSVVQKFAGAYPGRVLYYLVDDLGNTNCATLALWGQTNEITNVTVFSNPAINMWDYGTPGMPKTVAMAGPGHEVIFNQNSSVNVITLTNAISQCLLTGINGIPDAGPVMALYPNPLTDNRLTLKYTSNQMDDLNIGIYNIIGSKVKSLVLPKKSVGNDEFNIDLEILGNGLYYFRLNAGENTRTLKLIVNH